MRHADAKGMKPQSCYIKSNKQAYGGMSVRVPVRVHVPVRVPVPVPVPVPTSPGPVPRR